MVNTWEMLGELFSVVGEVLSEGEPEPGELIAAVCSWLGVVSGEIDGSERFRLAADELKAFHIPGGEPHGEPQDGNGSSGRLSPGLRWEAALELARNNGKVTSGALAKVAGCTPECARQTLKVMARLGELKPKGEYKSRCYVLARGLWR